MLLVFPRIAAMVARTRRRPFTRAVPLIPPARLAVATGNVMSVHQWIQRHINDPYVKATRKQELRSRAAFKLKEMQDKHRILRRGDCVIDLGCAPGGWSEVAAQIVLARATSSSNSPSFTNNIGAPPTKAGAGGGAITAPIPPGLAARGLSPRGLVIGIDKRPMMPLSSVVFLHGDFTDEVTLTSLRRALDNEEEAEEEEGGGRGGGGDGEEGGGGGGVRGRRRSSRIVDVILSDMAPDFSGDKFRDHRRTLDLGYEVLAFADRAFQGPCSSNNRSSSGASRRKGCNKKTVLIKLFKGRDEEEFLAYARARYNQVRLLKPKASRSESGEQYLLARDFKGSGGGGNEGDGALWKGRTE